MSVTFGTSDSKATALAFIFLIPLETLTIRAVCFTRAINIRSTKLKKLNTSDTSPIQKPLAKALRVTLFVWMAARLVIQNW
jgi:hypothetical protein